MIQETIDLSLYCHLLLGYLKKYYVISYMIILPRTNYWVMDSGFRSLHSTALALSQCTNDWIINIDRGDMSNVVFLDIKKAFDTVDHELLLKKLNKYGLYNDELKFFESYLSNRRQCCSVNGITSTLKPILCDVPQDSILGTTFVYYIHE